MPLRIGSLLVIAFLLLGCAAPVQTLVAIREAMVTTAALDVPPSPHRPPGRVPILLYHDLAPGAAGGNGATIDVAEFDRQMAWLATNGYTPISSAELLAWLEGKGRLPERPVQIHFDDGYLSNHTHALPIMQKHGMRGMLFLVSAFPDNPELHGMLTWHQVKEMAGSGTFEIHGHTHDGHRHANGLPCLIGWDEHEIRADYRTMVERITAAGLPGPALFAYPFGGYDAETIAALQAEGARAAFTVEHGYVAPGDDPYRLKRLIVWPGLTECQFAALVTGETACGKP